MHWFGTKMVVTKDAFYDKSQDLPAVFLYS
jgi:hypothetical protein